MECYTCKAKMKCTDDVNEINTRIDWFDCPKCKATAYISYGQNGKYIDKVVWKR